MHNKSTESLSAVKKLAISNSNAVIEEESQLIP
jgi:hypothetical protein